MTTTASTIPLQQLLEQASWAHRLARSLVHDADEADDLVQETWIATFRRPPEADRPLRPWLATVLRRQRNKHVVAGQRRGRREETAEVGTAHARSPEDLLERVEVQKLLATLVTALEEPYRQTVLLRYYEGLTSAQIARRLGAPAATVRGRLKVALDRLRDALDARNGGSRERWLSLLAPLVPGAVASGAGRTALVLAAVMLTLLPVGAWIAWRDHGSAASGAGDSAAGRPGGGGSRGGGAGRQMALAAVPGASVACTAAVKRLREQVGPAETEAMENMPGAKLFERAAAPNPAAAKELAASLARIMATDGPAPSYTLECRTWVCKMIVVKTADEGRRPKPESWELSLNRDAEINARLSGLNMQLDESPVRDPVSGQRLTTRYVYLILQDPSGKAAAAMGQRGRPKPTLAFGPIPTDVAGCQREVETLRGRLAQAQADLDTDLRPKTRFLRSGPNPALTTETAALVRRVFGADPAAPSVECRGIVCKLVGPEPNDPWRKRLEDDPEFHLRHDGLMWGTEILVLMKTPAQLAAARWLDKLGDAFIGGPAPAACEKKHKSEGGLSIVLVLPATGSPNEDGLVGRPSARFKGSLADSPLARCVADELARSALDAVAPEPTAAAKVYKRLKFPLAPATPAK